MVNSSVAREQNSSAENFYYAKKLGGKRITHGAVWHSCFELIWVRCGRVTLTVEGKETELNEGDVAIIPQFSLHSLSAKGEDTEIDCFAYSENVIWSPGISTINMKYLTPFRYKSAASGFVITKGSFISEKLYRCLNSVVEIQDYWDYGRELLARARFLEVHACVCSFFASTSAIGESMNSYLSGAEIYIENHITDSVTPYEIAAALHISNSHLSKIISSCLGCTTGELISRVKVRYAEKNMLTRSGANIPDVACDLGYRSLSAFNRAFNKIRGYTPAAFKKLYMPYDKAITKDGCDF